jgi:hypothetical protein
MAVTPSLRPPHWYGVPVRVLLLTFIGTLISFAVGLFFALFGTVVLSALKGIHPDFRIAYRSIALPVGLVAGGIILVLSIVMEIRHYRQSKALTTLEKMS